MPSPMHNLDRESILMLYLAGELPAEDQAELEALLAVDAPLRAQYEQILADHQAVVAVLGEADAKLPLPA